MSWFEWIANTFAMLPGCNNDLFRRLWKERRLRFNHQEQMLDTVDEYSVQLICAALNKRESLFLGLPDNRSHRPAFLFATALIQSWLDFRYLFRSKPSLDRTVLYFGASVGIREQLRSTTISKINLAEVFRQQDLGRRSTKYVRPIKSSSVIEQPSLSLPQVVTIYGPADPASILARYRPEWIGIDCGDALQLGWLESLLNSATKRNITVIAWGQNPLSEYVAQFAKRGLVFCWPMQLPGEVSSLLPDTENLSSVLQPGTSIQFHPIILQGPGVSSLETSLREAGQLLAQCSAYVTGLLGKDAVQLHWRYLRSLEMLTVPLDFFEAEAGKYWGIQSFTQLREACRSFREACRQNYGQLASYLEEASVYLEKGLESFQNAEPPLWNALSHLCIEEPPSGEVRVIIFTSRSRKRLFLFALLARYNITEEDLQTINVRLVSLDDLRKIVRSDTALPIGGEATPFTLDQTLRPHPLLAGLPSSVLTPKLLPVLLYQRVDVLIYPYQNQTFIRRASEWIKALEPNFPQMASVLSHLSGMNEPETLPSFEVKPNINEPVWIEVKSGQKKKLTQNEPLWQPPDSLQEVTRLLELEADEEITDYSASPDHILNSRETKTAEEVWCENGIEVEFDQGWHTTFAPDEMVNMVVSGSSGHGQRLDTRYVRSLKLGDRIIAIPGQRRQSLYDLLIARIHRHPSIELHIALIHRWQEDFVIAYQRWRQHNVRNLDDLLKQMQERGSTLTSSFTLRQWLWGHTLCPDDAEDLCRLADVLTMDFVGKYHHQIHNAANRLRGLHRSLSRRLNRWLDQEAGGLAMEKDNDIIDAELGLTFEDFRNSLLILSVNSVRSVIGPFLRSSLGRLERSNNDE